MPGFLGHTRLLAPGSSFLLMRILEGGGDDSMAEFLSPTWETWIELQVPASTVFNLALPGIRSEPRVEALPWPCKQNNLKRIAFIWYMFLWAFGDPQRAWISDFYFCTNIYHLFFTFSVNFHRSPCPLWLEPLAPSRQWVNCYLWTICVHLIKMHS